MNRRIRNRSLVAAVAAAAAVLTPVAASAQSYDYRHYDPAYGGSYGAPAGYDRCDREREGRTGAGGFIGATVGAVAGSQIAARGRRTEGSILGGVLGAIVGANVGRGSSDSCVSRSYAPAPAYAGGYGYDQGYGQPDRDYGYERDYAPQRQADYNRNYGYGDDRGYPVRESGYQNTDACRLAESRVRLPDGRSEVRYVRTCPDQYGRYRVVD